MVHGESARAHNKHHMGALLRNSFIFARFRTRRQQSAAKPCAPTFNVLSARTISRACVRVFVCE